MITELLIILALVVVHIILIVGYILGNIPDGLRYGMIISAYVLAVIAICVAFAAIKIIIIYIIPAMLVLYVTHRETSFGQAVVNLIAREINAYHSEKHTDIYKIYSPNGPEISEDFKED